MYPAYITQAVVIMVLIMGCGVASGLLGALLGLGGAVILTPLLTILLNLPIQYAAGISLVSAVTTSAMAGSRFLRMGLPNVRIYLILCTAGTLGAIIGSLITYHVIRTGYSWVLYVLFSAVMYMAMALTGMRRSEQVISPLRPEELDSAFIVGSYFDRGLKVFVTYRVNLKNVVTAWFIMLFGGLMSGLLGIGGGPINMLALYWAAGLPIKVASATSNLIVGVTAATSGSLYWLFGFIQPFMAMASIIGIAIGANISTHMLPRVKGPTIKALLLAIFSFLAYRMLLTGLRRGNIFVMPSTIENITTFLVLVISLAILMALRKYISE